MKGKFLIMSLAFSAADQLLEEKRINYTQYNEIIDDIRLNLNISENEYLAVLDKSWTDPFKKERLN